jgi:DNA-directed RNA polymerase specialized sigma24 family protein
LLRRIVINLNINRFHRDLSARFAFRDIDRSDRRGLLIDPSAGPERILAAEQQLDGVASLLSAGSRRTCQMFIAQRGGYSYGEVASAFAVKERTVEKHVAVATSMLQEFEHQGLYDALDGRNLHG